MLKVGKVCITLVTSSSSETPAEQDTSSQRSSLGLLQRKTSSVRNLRLRARGTREISERRSTNVDGISCWRS
jgi:hypothetical protein